MKRLIFVNGVPASGKSTVARAVSEAGSWPLFALDTIKEAHFAHLGLGDREYNRLLGRASFEAMFALAADAPPGMTLVMDAWFGFQPREVLDRHLTRVGGARVVQIWCHAPPEEVGRRYLARVEGRSAGHLGADYVPELIDLAHRAAPLEGFPTYGADTTAPFDRAEFISWLDASARTP